MVSWRVIGVEGHLADELLTNFIRKPEDKTDSCKSLGDVSRYAKQIFVSLGCRRKEGTR